MKTSAKKSKLREFKKSSAFTESPDLGADGPKTNHWSLSARQDIFARRQKGEDWKTICKDYPSRTRHAMQQQYSVMKRQVAPNSPRFNSSSRRGRKTRGSARNKWATVNKLRDSSEDGVESDADLDMDMDDEDEDDFDSDDHAAEDDSHVAEEDLAVEAGAQVDGVRPPTIGRSATEPSSHASIPRRATFPNLPGFAARPMPTLANKSTQPEPPKRKNDTEATDSESKTSSHLSKRRKYSTEPSETFNPVSADLPAPLKALVDSINLSGMVFYPEAVAKANEDFRNLSLAYAAEKVSRQETFEAALKRATRRANDAEHKLQDTSQSYADKMKANDEAHTKSLETLRQEVADLTVSLTASRESLKTASESPPLRTALLEKETQLARHDQLRSQLVSEIENFRKSHTKAALNADALKVQHEKHSKIIDKFDWEEVTMKTLKRYAMEMKDESRIMGGLVGQDVGEWGEIGKLVDGLGKIVDIVMDEEKADSVADTATTTAFESAVVDKQPSVQRDGV